MILWRLTLGAAALLAGLQSACAAQEDARVALARPPAGEARLSVPRASMSHTSRAGSVACGS